ncbi:MAG: hypothetical protein H0U61_11655 [Nocardioidaceae bacterium]|nr:hypothetical protein [Nocardioidaceae bacterium]
MVLTSQPTATVDIVITGLDATEGSLSATTLTFLTTGGAGGWNSAQVLTVTGVNDDIDDGDIGYTLTLTPSSSDGVYALVSATTIAITNSDDDARSVIVTESGGTAVSEAGLTDTYTVRLASEPTGPVTVTISASAQITAGPATLTFAPSGANAWNLAQTVTVSAIDDAIAEGNHAGTVAHGVSGGDYAGVTALSVAVTITDNDTAAVLASAGTVTTAESGTSQVFQVHLSSQPTADVTVTIASSVIAEATVSPTILTFTPGNWSTDQPVTVTGIDDQIDDGNQGYTVTLTPSSGDAFYAVGGNAQSAAVVSVSGTNTDDDTAGITTSVATLTTAESGTATTFTVRLDSMPMGPVTVTVVSGNSGEGTVSPGTLNFDATNWSATQTVTVVGVDDLIDDGDKTYAVTLSPFSGDANYNGAARAVSVTATNTDDDTAGFTVSAISGNTTESGGQATFTVTLTSQPTSPVSVTLSTGNAAEGTLVVGSTPSTTQTLTFTSGNWYQARTITVRGIDDAIDDGNQVYSIDAAPAAIVSADPKYNGGSVTISVTNVDDDTAGIVATPAVITTTEAGGTATFQVHLRSQPTAAVTVAVVSGNTAEGTVSTASLSFDGLNWSADQPVTPTGIDDFVDDGDKIYAVTLTPTSADGSYNGAARAVAVAATNTDDDAAAVQLSTTNITTVERGSKVTVNVVLLSQPTANVRIDLDTATLDTSEVAVDMDDSTPGVQTFLTFTPGSWNVAQTLAVTPVDDGVIDGDRAYTVKFNNCVSTDPAFTGRVVPIINGTNVDNTIGFTITPVAGPATTTELGGSRQFQIVLTSQPTQPVTLTVSGLDASEGTLSATTITFQPGSAPAAGAWNTVQVLTVTGANDPIDDGDVLYTLTVTPSSADVNYNPPSVPAQTIAITNTDDDANGVSISSSSLAVIEGGAADSFDVALTAQPTGVVTVTVTPDAQVLVNGSANPLTLTFDSSTWNTAQPVTVAAVQDHNDEAGVHAGAITIGVAGSGYNAVTAGPVAVAVTDNRAPVMTANAALTIARGGTLPLDLLHLDASDVTPSIVGDPETAQAGLVITILLAPSQGTLTRSGVALVKNDVFTIADVANGIVSYTHGGASGSSDGFAFRVSDAFANLSGLEIFAITITGESPPVVVMPNAAPTYNENAPPLILDKDGAASDIDSTYYSKLTISYAANGSPSDQLGVRNQGVGFGLIATGSGGVVTFGAVGGQTTIGTITNDGSNGGPLVIALIPTTADDVAVSALLQNIQFWNTSDAPSILDRTLSIVLKDVAAIPQDSAPVTKIVYVTATNDPPTIGSPGVLTAASVPVTFTISVGDVDLEDVTVSVSAAPGKGALSTSGGFPATVAGPASGLTVTYTPIPGQVGVDSFILTVGDGTVTVASLPISVLITGGDDPRPWIVSDPPVEAEIDPVVPFTYAIALSLADYGPAFNPNSINLTYSLIGDFTGVTAQFTPGSAATVTVAGGTAVTLNLLITAPIGEYLDFGIVITDGAGNRVGYQPVLMRIVTAGGGGG